MLIGSLCFYFVGTLSHPEHFILFLVSILIDFFAGLLIERHKKHKRLFLFIGILFHLLALCVFKYLGFIFGEVSRLLPEAFDLINKDIDELTDALVQQFYSDLAAIGDDGHGSVYADYQTVTDTERWFTLKIRVTEASGSSNTYFKYYHVNKQTGSIVRLGDLAADNRFYERIEQEIQKQMRTEMEQNSDLIYWTEDSVIGKDLRSVSPDHNFYWNKDGDLVIPFDKYEIAPGYMGTPEFTISKELLKDVMKSEFKDEI